MASTALRIEHCHSAIKKSMVQYICQRLVYETNALRCRNAMVKKLEKGIKYGMYLFVWNKKNCFLQYHSWNAKMPKPRKVQATV